MSADCNCGCLRPPLLLGDSRGQPSLAPPHQSATASNLGSSNAPLTVAPETEHQPSNIGPQQSAPQTEKLLRDLEQDSIPLAPLVLAAANKPALEPGTGNSSLMAAPSAPSLSVDSGSPAVMDTGPRCSGYIAQSI